MTLANSLAEFRAGSAASAGLVASAHHNDANGAPLFSATERAMITAAAFLNVFKLWEAFLEASISKYLSGEPSITGAVIVKHASPVDEVHARTMFIGVMNHFDYANHENVRAMARIYFDSGKPYDPHLSAIFTDLADLRTMRNAVAHISSTTQSKLDTLAQRIFGTPQPNISLYDMLLRVDPRSPTGETVFEGYQSKLLAAADLIARG